ncbi:uncharacterized protein LOC124280626 [Haliotis rubra]|uniref:uncharacterized protein LOC124280626 n=1 Tax=Haliotis rubra TaxID=36100 RepID=UPI001EE5F3E0|nr:uncharacterized protein LOC124280626 [Haliotis rubra]
MADHVNYVAKICYFHLRNIGRVRPLLTKEAAVTLCRSLVSSRIDYCNGLLAGSPSCLTDRLQRVQNTAARITSQSHRYDHISPVLQELHWLPVKHRINLKILCLAHQCLTDSAPVYLSELIQPYCPYGPLRSENQNLLTVPKVKLTRFGQRSFSYAAAKERNDLPPHIRPCSIYPKFRSLKRTHLFREAFS